ncbi:sugar kinase [Caviibacterium pharyngocola]|uniref:2-dehydro-3-deoxygluconokinase n=1 Tax=Caviibacterium pharyngocola TaxID=28159 RepID=A0A2M8RTI7_9PAST|nr:sugar kinase [Caviibacterium pharyngocola]PJG82189.1 ketodeoxygluconokinase [Caviibacterium pharyngocola]
MSVSQNIAIIGECMIELSQKNSDLRLGFGGDTLNTAVYLARLLPAEQFAVHYVSALGTDPYSQNMLTQWQQEGVQTGLVQRLSDKLPGLYSIVTDEQGERSFFYWRNNSAAKYWLQTEQTEQILVQLMQCQYVYLSGISLAILDEQSLQKLFEFLPHFKPNGGKIIFDNNYRPILWQNKEATRKAYRQMLALTDIAFLTLDDEDKLWDNNELEHCIERTQSFGVKEIVIKRGAESCIVQSGEQRYDIPAQKIENVVDTTAAGDSFSAGYLAARLSGSDEIQSARQGHRIAGQVIQHRGAIIPVHLFA